jgi:hypothetical protein
VSGMFRKFTSHLVMKLRNLFICTYSSSLAAQLVGLGFPGKTPCITRVNVPQVLPLYIVVMLSHGNTKALITDNLDAFLGANAASFTEWCGPGTPLWLSHGRGTNPPTPLAVRELLGL